VQTLAIIVNYKVAALTVKAAHSVLESESLFPCRVVVVDNSEDVREEKLLRSALPRGVDLVVPPDNLGFGRACNLALKEFKGDFILLLNPDARLLPGCLIRLQQTLLKKEKIAAVGPQVFWDDDGKYCLPPPSPPFMFLFSPALTGLSSRSWIKKVINRAWRCHAVKVWRSKTPLKTGNLSGGHVLLRRKAVELAGGLFDPRFFLYFEDTDLFMRLRKAGYSLVFDAGARVVHHYDQSAWHETEQKRRLFQKSHELFRQKYLTGGKSCFYALLERFAALSGGEEGGAGEEEWPLFTAPFTLEVPETAWDNWLFEWSPVSDFTPAAGMFGRGEFLDFTAEYWNMLAPGRYYGRLGRPGILAQYIHQISWNVQ
jgi:GT2 family glycosyltransferase